MSRAKLARPGWLFPFLAGLAARVAYPWYGHGFHHMDEHWQVIEPANHLLHRDWSPAREWVEGSRSWIYPWLVSFPMRAAELLGLNDPLWINSFIRSIHGLVAALAIPLVYISVDKLAPGRPRRWPLWAAWMTALWPFAISCGTRTQGDLAGALLILAAFAAPIIMSDRKRGEAAGHILSGAAFGAAIALKADVAVAGVAYGLWQVIQLRFRRAAWLLAGVLPFVILVGLVDRLTWGAWFHSLLLHAQTNLVEGVGNQWGVSPWYMHVAYFFDIAGAPALLAAAVLPLCWRGLPEKLRAGWFMSAVFVAVFAAVPHKEKRFIAPLLYVAIACAFATLAHAEARIKLSARTRRQIALALAAALAIHATANAVTYLVRRPWWNRIEAMRNAARIPGIQKMFSPEWPAVFYLPRDLPGECIAADRATLKAKTAGLRDIGVALDWKDLSPLTELGFRCEVWAGVPGEPSAYHCQR